MRKKEEELPIVNSYYKEIMKQRRKYKFRSILVNIFLSILFSTCIVLIGLLIALIMM